MTESASGPNIPSDAVTLTGGRMPLLGFGTWQLTGSGTAACRARRCS
jgi:hypothetical protein